MGLIYGNIFINEAMIQMSDKQRTELINLLNKKYVNEISKVYKSCISKCPKLKKYTYNRSNLQFRYDKYIDPDSIVCYIDAFSNYPYEDGVEGEKAIKLLNDMKNDLNKLDNLLKENLKPLKVTHKFLDADEDTYDSISGYIDIMSKYIKDYGYVPSNVITLYIIIKIDKVKSLIPSEDAIKKSERDKYLKLYDDFAKFIKHPYKLSGTGFWSGHIHDICKLIGMSSERFNELVSDNISTVGSKVSYKTDDEFNNYLNTRIGDHYILESSDSTRLVYSINKKRVYYIDYESEECEIFYNNYPYTSKELEDFVYGNNEEDISMIKSLFKERDKDKKYNLFK